MVIQISGDVEEGAASARDGRRGGVACESRPPVLAAHSKLGHTPLLNTTCVFSARKAQISRPRQSNPWFSLRRLSSDLDVCRWASC
jgi:hypothetical protein